MYVTKLLVPLKLLMPLVLQLLTTICKIYRWDPYIALRVVLGGVPYGSNQCVVEEQVLTHNIDTRIQSNPSCGMNEVPC
jgi:hypothetical protein